MRGVVVQNGVAQEAQLLNYQTPSTTYGYAARDGDGFVMVTSNFSDGRVLARRYLAGEWRGLEVVDSVYVQDDNIAIDGSYCEITAGVYCSERFSK